MNHNEMKQIIYGNGYIPIYRNKRLIMIFKIEENNLYYHIYENTVNSLDKSEDITQQLNTMLKVAETNSLGLELIDPMEELQIE